MSRMMGSSLVLSGAGSMGQGGVGTGTTGAPVRTAADICFDIQLADEERDAAMMSMKGFRRRLELSSGCPDHWPASTKLAHYRYRGDYISNQLARRARKLGRVSCKVQQIKECLAAMGVVNAEVEALTGYCPSPAEVSSIPVLSSNVKDPSMDSVDRGATGTGLPRNAQPMVTNTVEPDLSALIVETESALAGRAQASGHSGGSGASASRMAHAAGQHGGGSGGVAGPAALSARNWGTATVPSLSASSTVSTQISSAAATPSGPPAPVVGLRRTHPHHPQQPQQMFQREDEGNPHAFHALSPSQSRPPALQSHQTSAAVVPLRRQ